MAEVDTALKTSAIGIRNANPDDHVTFEAARQQGLDLIDKMGVDPGIRQQMAKDWFGTAAKARFEALIAKDPKRALEMFGGEAPASGSEAAGDRAQAVDIPVKGDRVGKRMPDKLVKRAFGDPAPDPMAIKPATAGLADLSPTDIQQLIDQASAANTAQLIEARTNIALASQNAPDAFAKTGSYSGTMPSPADFATVYGTEEGGNRYRDFSLRLDVGRQAFNMRTMSNQAIHAAVRDAEPALESYKKDHSRYQIMAAAAGQTIEARRTDPAGYVRKVFPNVDAAWRDASESQDYHAAVVISAAAQAQLGIEDVQPLPNSIAEDLILFRHKTG